MCHKNRRQAVGGGALGPAGVAGDDEERAGRRSLSTVCVKMP